MKFSFPANISKDGRWLKIVISLFIIIHTGLIIAWLSPEDIAFRKRITDSISSPWKFFGLSQGWKLFAPTVRNFNAHSIALITFEDGSMTQWPLPRLDQMNFIEKFQRDKFRKWNGDNLHSDRYKHFYRDLAIYAGRLHYSNGAVKPVSFSLMQFMAFSPDITSQRKRTDLLPHTDAQLRFFYRYQPEDFST